MSEIREARKKNGMSIRALAEAVGVRPATICRYEQGQRVPSVEMAKQLEKVLNVPWYILIDIERAG